MFWMLVVFSFKAGAVAIEMPSREACMNGLIAAWMNADASYDSFCLERQSGVVVNVKTARALMEAGQ